MHLAAVLLVAFHEKYEDEHLATIPSCQPAWPVTLMSYSFVLLNVLVILMYISYVRFLMWKISRLQRLSGITNKTTSDSRCCGCCNSETRAPQPGCLRRLCCCCCCCPQSHKYHILDQNNSKHVATASEEQELDDMF